MLSFSHSVMSDSLWPHRLQHSKLPCPSPGACSNSCPLNCWCHLTISSSVVSFSCLQSFPASGSFPMSQLFILVGQSIEALWMVYHNISQPPSFFWGGRYLFIDWLAAPGVSWGTQPLRSQLQYVGSFSYSMWDLVPWAGIEPRPSTLGVRCLGHRTTREVP